MQDFLMVMQRMFSDNIDFTQAASTSVQAVVHIKTKIAAQKVSNELPRSNNRSRGGIDDCSINFLILDHK
jgi:hypothetical protein